MWLYIQIYTCLVWNVGVRALLHLRVDGKIIEDMGFYDKDDGEVGVYLKEIE